MKVGKAVERTEEAAPAPVRREFGSDAERIAEARRLLGCAVPDAVEALVKEATKGSAGHIKLLLQLVGLDEGMLASQEARPREKTLEEILKERWEREP